MGLRDIHWRQYCFLLVFETTEYCDRVGLSKHPWRDLIIRLMSHLDRIRDTGRL